MVASDTYRDQASAFLATCTNSSGVVDPIVVFHRIRNFAYASRGRRDPQSVLELGEGSCSGKHLLLRDLLRLMGMKADVEIAEGDFAAGVPPHPSMPSRLKTLVQEAGVRDFHQYVVWTSDTGERLLDATWPDSVAHLGIPTNAGWDGQDNTRLALEPVAHHGRPDDLITKKNALLAGLSEPERAKRQEFLTLLTEWLDAEAVEDNGNERRTG